MKLKRFYKTNKPITADLLCNNMTNIAKFQRSTNVLGVGCKTKVNKYIKGWCIYASVT